MVLGGGADLKKKNSLLFLKKYYLREEQGNMRINKLVFRNIASYKGEYEIDFDIPVLKNSGIFLISGNTGSGKSTILDCITLALYARVYRLDRNVSDAISKGFESAYVRLTFTVSGKVYESFIELSVRQKETPKNMLLTNLSDSSYMENRDDILDYIKSLCRLDFDQFCQTVILPQGNFQEFLTSKPKNKTAIIDNIFNLKKYDGIVIFLKKELEFTDSNIEKLRFLEAEEKNRIDINCSKVNELTNFLNLVDVERLRRNLDEMYKLIPMCDQMIKVNQKCLDIKDSIYKLRADISSKIQNKEKLDHEYSLHENGRVELEKSLKLYNSYEFSCLDNLIKRKSELLCDKNRFLSQLVSVQTDLEELKSLSLEGFNFDYIKELYCKNFLFSELNFDGSTYEKLNLERKRVEEEIEKLLTEQTRKNSELKSIALEEASFDFNKYIHYEALKLFGCFNENLILKYRNELELFLKSDDGVQQDIDVKKSLYEKFLKDLGNNKKSIDSEIESLKFLENAYKTYQGKEHLKAANLGSLLELNTRLQASQAELGTINSDILDERENKNRWESQTIEFNKRNEEIVKRVGSDLFDSYIDYSDKNKISIFEDKIREAENWKTTLNDLNSKISLKEVELKENLDKIREVLSCTNLNLSLKSPVSLEQEFEKILRDKNKRENEYSEIGSMLSNINNSRLRLESQIEVMDQNIANLREELREGSTRFTAYFLDFKESVGDTLDVQERFFSFGPSKPSRDSLDYLSKLKSDFTAQIELLSKEISKYDSSFSSMQILNEELYKQKINLENIQRELRSVSERKEKIEFIKKVVIASPSLKYYVQSFLIEDILDIANRRYLSVILPDFKLQINSDSREFDFLVKSKRDGNMTRNVKTLSGGEKFLVSLSLSLAFSDMIRDSDLKIEAFFLDEGFGSLDEDTLKMVIPKISEFQRIDGRQIGVISHVTYLKEEIKARIVVSKISKVSKITIESF
ncbi:AAA family ATPase [Borrelia sp. RT5S]|uniref:AAA family ATPase n=1 Tax=Borrelia sp. RT5S TaxID=2898581 RepID=UPI001E286C26|nr:SMC family ATPase [Borrelia sp. RT5S]UGQ16475.1 SMC family ATPase [Borrelia sp. RT5S]